MNYKEAVDFIYSREMFANSSGFERIEALLKKLNCSEPKMKFIHVVGTNGKGSTSVMLANILKEGGFKTGLFTSPFVTEFRERIVLDGKYIEKEEFSKVVEKVRAACLEIEKEGLVPTFFETVFASAILFYCENGCEIAVIEAGIGGKEDSTNIIPAPLAAVVTSVSFDHTAVLGNTLSEIAAAKSAVIKKGSIAVSFPRENGGLDFVSQRPEVCAEIEKAAEKSSSRVFYPETEKVKDVVSTLEKTSFKYKEKPYEIHFLGDHQIANAITAITVAENLKSELKLRDEDIQLGLSKAFLPARMEIVSKKPLVIIDGGHNEGCMKALSKMISFHLKNKKITALMGFMKDKDYKAALEIVAPDFENLVFTKADGERGETAERLKKSAEGLCQNIFALNNQQEAFEKAMKLCGEDGVLICAGSFYLVSEIRKNFFV
ncbi:MAG: bifunctional folylpolyglutamate synthase/dihydrofolate synthase [Clostridia bacterium]|nr:bifunctional folylpolyglutamate synthase/dihydrofolate synthase [Clostridia bacterium]